MVLSFNRLNLLFFNHFDAWVTTLGISIGVLVIHDAFSWSAGLLVFSITLGYWLAFAINDYFDAEVDARDPVKSTRNYFSNVPTSAAQALIGFGGAALLIAPGFLQFRVIGVLTAALSLFIMWSYSAPPFRFKSRPGFDLLLHALFVETFPYGMLLFLLDLTVWKLDFVLLGLGLFASTTAQIEQQLRDVDQDRADEGQTFTLWLGESRALFLLKILTAGMIAFGFYFVFDRTIPLSVLPIGLLALPAVLLRFFRQPNQPRPERLIRILMIGVLIYVIGLIAVFSGQIGSYIN